jgi:site-specific DNA-methyltransferase (adenine-specific)
MIDIAQKPHYCKTDVIASTVILGDCVELMKAYPDNHFDLAVVDVPYGLDEANGKNNSRNKGFGKGNLKSKKITFSKDYGIKNWDKNPPNEDYFKELFRVSKNQIVWGANHFISRLPYDSSCWLVWDKDNGNSDFADAELAWTSFKKAVRLYKYRWNGLLQQDMKNKEIRIHPTQKPVGLYDWIFNRFATEGMKILDTHLGSGSSRISADKAKLDFTGMEIDKEYFDLSEKRYQNYKSQLRLW